MAIRRSAAEHEVTGSIPGRDCRIATGVECKSARDHHGWPKSIRHPQQRRASLPVCRFLDVTPNTLAEYLLKLLVSFVAYLADAIGDVSVFVCMGVCESSSCEEVAT